MREIKRKASRVKPHRRLFPKKGGLINYRCEAAHKFIKGGDTKNKNKNKNEMPSRERGKYFAYYRRERDLLKQICNISVDPNLHYRKQRDNYRYLLFNIIPMLKRKLWWRPDREAIAALEETLSQAYSCSCRLRILYRRYVFIPLQIMQDQFPEYFPVNYKL